MSTYINKSNDVHKHNQSINQSIIFTLTTMSPSSVVKLSPGIYSKKVLFIRQNRIRQLLRLKFTYRGHLRMEVTYR